MIDMARNLIDRTPPGVSLLGGCELVVDLSGNVTGRFIDHAQDTTQFSSSAVPTRCATHSSVALKVWRTGVAAVREDARASRDRRRLPGDPWRQVSDIAAHRPCQSADGWVVVTWW